MAQGNDGAAINLFLYAYVSGNPISYSARRLIGWAAVFLLNVVIPIGMYRLNAHANHPDSFISVIVFVWVF
jgi:hypothetical protein